MGFTDKEYILLFANHMLSEAGNEERNYFKTPEEAIEWMDQAIKDKWLDPDELLLKLPPITSEFIPEWARESYIIAVDHKGDVE